MKIRKAAVFSTALLVCLLTAACSGGNRQSSKSGVARTEARTLAEAPVEATWPLTPTKQTFTIFTEVTGRTVEDVRTNAFTAWYEEKTNVSINWQVVTSGAGQQIPLLS